MVFKCLSFLVVSHEPRDATVITSGYHATATDALGGEGMAKEGIFLYIGVAGSFKWTLPISRERQHITHD